MADEQIGRLLVLLEAQTAKLDEQIQQSTRGLTTFKGAVDLAKDALAVLGVGEIFKSVIEATAEGEKAQALLESQIKATGAAAGFTAEQLVAMAHGFQDTTTTSATQVEQLEGQLLAFRNIAGDQFKAVIQAALDFSAVTGKDASAAVTSLGMALNDPITGMQRLSRAGIELSSSVKQVIKSLAEQGDIVGAQKVLLDQMTQSYGGAAAAARNTLSGALQVLKNDFNDMLEGHGAGVADMTAAVHDLDDTLKDPSTAEGLQTIVTGVLELASAAAKAASTIAAIPKSLGQVLASAFVTGNDNDIPGMVKDLQVEISSLQSQIERANEENNNEGLLGKLIAPDTSKLQARLDQAQLSLQGLLKLQDSIHARNIEPTNVPEAFPKYADFPDLGKSDSIPGFDLRQVALGYDSLAQAQKKAVDIWKENDPAAYLQEQIQKTNDLVGVQVDGITFTADDAQKHIASLQLEYDKQNDAMVASAQSAAQSIQSDFATYFMDPFKEGLGGLAKAFEQTLLQMLAQAEAAQLMKSLFGGYDTTGNNNGNVGLGMVLSNFFGGHRAGGGPASAGMLYQVNEGGPNTEGFIPSTGGQIIPLGTGTGTGNWGGDVNINYSIDARGADGASAAQFLQALPALRRLLHADVEHRVSRGVWPA